MPLTLISVNRLARAAGFEVVHLGPKGRHIPRRG